MNESAPDVEILTEVTDQDAEDLSSLLG